MPEEIQQREPVPEDEITLLAAQKLREFRVQLVYLTRIGISVRRYRIGILREKLRGALPERLHDRGGVVRGGPHMLVVFVLVFFLVMVVLPGVLHSLGDFLVKKRNRVRHAEGLHLRRGFQHALDPLVGLAAVVDEKVAAAYLYDVLCGGVVAVALLTGLEQHFYVRRISENLPRKVIRRKYRRDDLQLPADF